MKTIYMIGDSTMQYNDAYTYPQTGWGQVLPLFLKEGYTIVNLAKNGRSSKSFIDEKRFDVVINNMKKGDYVICQFGHNDEKSYDQTRYTTPDGTYIKNMEYFKENVLKLGGHIVFLTSICRRNFLDGVCVDTHMDYPKCLVNYCRKNNLTCIDMNSLTLDLYNRLGSEKTKRFHMILEPNVYDNYKEGKVDNTHLVNDGAYMVSKLFVENIKKTNDPINECFIDLDDNGGIDLKELEK